MKSKKIPLIVIGGPTATGKTRLSVELAKKLDGEIISADSMQIYRGMNIGTAKPTKEEMCGIPHHLMDIIEPTENFSVARFTALAHAAAEDINCRGKLPIVVGGTGLYIDSMVENITFFDQYDDNHALRAELQEKYDSGKAEEMYTELMKVDPETAEKFHHNNAVKLIRALEVYYNTGVTLSEWARRSHQNPSPYKTAYLVLNFADRNQLYQRIDLRVDQMITSGLVEEARKIYELNLPQGSTAGAAIGYKELFDYFDGKITLTEAADRIKLYSRRYAKRQLTWFKRNENAKWLEASCSFEEVCKAAENYIKKNL